MYQKHSRSPLMAGSCSQTQRVALLGLMRGTTWMAPSSSDHSRIHSTQNTGENGGTGAQLGADRRAWEGNGLSPASAGQGREAQSQPRSRVLDTGNTKGQLPQPLPASADTRSSEGRLRLTFYLFS